ncbi:hypothetical protein [Chryseolinea sp. H1M3-3]|uniref:hypothetical protein n=1 Tax=Chryseolinea sp. H1M3-3 TaxID=3034144 RepID=UPI0023EE1D76|nr:hypothetical protein [Chryseolinea sp. H1M3-3]
MKSSVCPLSAKTDKAVIIFLFVTLITSCVDHNIEYDPCVKFDIHGTYEYPIPFQSDAWFELRSLEERVDACQIPQQVLDTITTEALLETLLNYPLLFEYTAFDVMQNGFERIKGEQKGFAEFYSRKDAFEIALDRYTKMSVRCDNFYPPFLNEIKTPASISFANFEFVMFQDEFMNALDEKEVQMFFERILQKLELKYQYGEEYKEYGVWISCAILGKIMLKNDFQPFKDFCVKEPFMEFFVQRVPVFRPENVDVTGEIFQYAKQYAKVKG